MKLKPSKTNKNIINTAVRLYLPEKSIAFAEKISYFPKFSWIFADLRELITTIDNTILMDSRKQSLNTTII